MRRQALLGFGPTCGNESNSCRILGYTHSSGCSVPSNTFAVCRISRKHSFGWRGVGSSVDVFRRGEIIADLLKLGDGDAVVQFPREAPGSLNSNPSYSCNCR